MFIHALAYRWFKRLLRCTMSIGTFVMLWKKTNAEYALKIVDGSLLTARPVAT